MRIINSKKKLRLSPESALDILGVAIFAAILFVAAFFLLRRSETIFVTLRVTQTENQNLTRFERTPEWYIEQLKPGIRQSDFFGRTILSIHDVYYYPNNDTRQTVFVVLKMKAVFDENNQQFTFNGLPVQIGSFQNLKLANITINGIIHDLRRKQEKADEKWFEVAGVLQNQFNEEITHDAQLAYDGVPNFVAEKLTVGQQVFDSNGNTILEILKVNKFPATREFIAGSQVIRVSDERRQRVELTARVKARNINGRYLYREEERILLNNLLQIPFSNFTVFLTVTDVQPLNPG